MRPVGSVSEMVIDATAGGDDGKAIAAQATLKMTHTKLVRRNERTHAPQRDVTWVNLITRYSTFQGLQFRLGLRPCRGPLLQ